MSEQKRALVVDDSKSARLVLRRMLEKHGILVDTVESAADALEFLIGNRPDVIFMDHMMPGMDGFEAVRAIKDNPQTATIPVMMYTSKGGDLYLGQARALGAVGVLPKTVAPAELYKSLLRIGLVRERRSADEPDARRSQDGENASERLEDLHRQQEMDIPVAAAAFSEHRSGEDEEPLPTQVRRLLDEQRVGIRKDLLLGLDTLARQSREKLDRLLDEKIAALREQLPPPAAPLSVLPTVLLVVLLFVSVAWNFSARNEAASNAQPVAANVAAGEQMPTSVLAAGETAPATDDGEDTDNKASQNLQAIWQNVSWALNQDTRYPWNEIALDGARMQMVGQLLERLARSGFAGKLILETHVGEFCLQGNPDKGFRPADDDTTLDQCSAIMNPVQPTDAPSTHQSLPFANLIASSPALQDGSISLEIQAIPRSEPLVAYPPREAATKAGEWNRVAAANNRITFRLLAE